MDFDLFSPTALDIEIWVCFDPILEWRQNEGLGMSQNNAVLKNWSQKWVTNLDKTIVIEFDLFITFGVKYEIWSFSGPILNLGFTRIVKFPF